MFAFLVHIHTGPDDPNKATLGCLVAATAAQAGHDTALFLAGDGVRLLDPSVTASLEGQGTGRLGDHLEALAAADGRIFVSGKSARARGFDDSLLAGHPAEFAMPDRLVALASGAATVLCY